MATFFLNGQKRHLCSMHDQRPEILLETPDWIAVNKPSGLLTIPDRHNHDLPTVKGWLEHKYGPVFTVHRIDRDTSGLLLFARNEAAHKYLSQLFESRNVEKIYLGIVLGKPISDTGTIAEPIAEHPAKNGTMVVNRKGKMAVTHYKVLEAFNHYSLLEFNIETGRTHQIRVHAKHMGHPIAADPLYGNRKPVFLSDFKRNVKLGKFTEQENPLLSRLALHAYKIKFTDMDSKVVELEAPLYKDMRALVNQLERNGR